MLQAVRTYQPTILSNICRRYRRICFYMLKPQNLVKKRKIVIAVYVTGQCIIYVSIGYIMPVEIYMCLVNIAYHDLYLPILSSVFIMRQILLSDILWKLVSDKWTNSIYIIIIAQNYGILIPYIFKNSCIFNISFFYRGNIHQYAFIAHLYTIQITSIFDVLLCYNTQ